ncbi:hypothetical protein ACWEPL_59890 [Nonomuraea sp. NPDC004186]
MKLLTGSVIVSSVSEASETLPRARPAASELGDAELLGRPADVLVARHDLEKAQRQQIHYASVAMTLWENWSWTAYSGPA